jgi:probable HAF family extracellular repeat protein
MKTLPLFLLGLMACLAIGVTTARGQVYKYSLEDLGVVKGMEASQPAAMNNLTHITGTAYKSQQACAFYYDYSKKIMEDAGGINSRGFGISSTNTVVGDAFFNSSTAPESHAAILQGGFAKDLGVLKGYTFSRANGVNAMWQVVGFSALQRDSSQSRAFMWSPQLGMIDIGTLGGLYAQANAINDAGFITGWAQTQGSGPMLTTHAFTYQSLSPTPYQRMHDLGVLGGLSSYGMAINNLNHVVGYSTFGMNDPRVHAFLHDGSRMIDLGSLSPWSTSKSNFSVALGVNKLDQVVGFTYLPAVGETASQQVAFVWTRYNSRTDTGKMFNLNTLLNDTGKNYLLLSAVAINDTGQILAAAYNITDGGNLRAVLLTPVRPPVGQ